MDDANNNGKFRYVWDYFEHVVDEYDENTEYALCRMCDFQLRFFGPTDLLKSHLSSEHYDKEFIKMHKKLDNENLEEDENDDEEETSSSDETHSETNNDGQAHPEDEHEDEHDDEHDDEDEDDDDEDDEDVVEEKDGKDKEEVLMKFVVGSKKPVSIVGFFEELAAYSNTQSRMPSRKTIRNEMIPKYVSKKNC